MGYYINEDSKGAPIGSGYRSKVNGLIADGAIVTTGNEFVDNLVVVVDNGMFGAAAFAYSEGEYKYFRGQFAGDDTRPHTWLVHPKAKELSGFAPKEALSRVEVPVAQKSVSKPVPEPKKKKVYEKKPAPVYTKKPAVTETRRANRSEADIVSAIRAISPGAPSHIF